jgi:hypothetical protein
MLFVFRWLADIGLDRICGWGKADPSASLRDDRQGAVRDYELRVMVGMTTRGALQDSGEVGADDGDGGDGSGFGAEDAGAEGDVLPVMVGEEGHLFRGPAAFRADS